MKNNELIESENHDKNEIIFKESKLMLILTFMIIPFYAGMEIIFKLIWENKERMIDLNVPLWIKFASVIIAIFLHELLHGLVFSIYAQGGFKSVSFGFSKTMGSPYCHCSQPVKIKQYMLAGITPFVVLGLVPLLIGMITGTAWIKTFGILLSIGGFGDLIVWIKLLGFDKNIMVLDHPAKMGFIIME